MPDHEPEVERAIEKVRGHKWFYIGMMTNKWVCEFCGAEANAPLSTSDHWREDCPAKKKRT